MGHDLYVIHQNCDYYSSPNCAPTKKYSPGRVTRVDSEIGHDADTLGGSSGSAVFSATSHRVFALHHVGVGNNGNGRGTANYAVPMPDILSVLESRFPDIVLGGGDPQQQTPGPAGDDLEPNDAFSNATPPSLPVDVSGLSIHSASDVDVFRIELSQRMVLHVEVRFAQAAGDLDIALYSGTNTQSPVARGQSTTDDEVISVEIPAGTYHLAVYGYSGATGAYEITARAQAAVQTQPPSSSSPGQSSGSGDAFEPNDSFSNAAFVSLPFGWQDLVISSANDEDLFVFERNGGTHAISIDFSHAQGDLDLYVYDASGNEVARSVSVTDGEEIPRSFAAGRSIVRVHG